MSRQATRDEIRDHYEDRGHIVHISKDGRVMWKANGEGLWMEGRWVEEYQISKEFGVRVP